MHQEFAFPDMQESNSQNIFVPKHDCTESGWGFWLGGSDGGVIQAWRCVQVQLAGSFNFGA